MVVTPPQTLLPFFGSGLAFGDLDLDGDVDAVVAAPDALHVLLGDGAGAFVEAPGAFAGASPPFAAAVSVADGDGDRDLDLLLTTSPPGASLRYFENDGAGVFVDQSDAVGLPVLPQPTGLAWADYDRDGWLDVFVAGIAGSALLRNSAGLVFEDVTADLGLEAPLAYSCQPVWVDFDLDGDVDLFIANDMGGRSGLAALLYRNDGSAGFVEVAASAGITERIDGMGVAVGDADGDLDPDLYVTNVGWVPVAGTGQLFYVNGGDGTFTQEAAAFGATAADRWGWGAEFLDWDADGDLDLAVGSLVNALAPGAWLGESAAGTLLDVTGALAAFPTESTYGVATADFDEDGRLDVGWATSAPTVAARLYRNVAPVAGHWLRVRLSMPGTPNVHAIGATVFVEAAGVRRLRAISAGGSYYSSSEPVAHFGLGAATAVDEIEVWWPDGSTTVLPGPIAADQTLVVTP